MSEFVCDVAGCPNRTGKKGFSTFPFLLRHCKKAHFFNSLEIAELHTKFNESEVTEDNSSVNGDGASVVSTLQSQLESVTTQMEDLQEELLEFKETVATKETTDNMNSNLDAIMQVYTIYSYIC